MSAHLCATCEHARLVRGARTTFWNCAKSAREPATYPRYPRVPVTTCPGHQTGAPKPYRE